MAAKTFQLIAPPPTPFQPDGALDLPAVAEQARFLAAAGVDGVFVCGSTGEGQSLGLSERFELTEAWCEARRETGVRTIIHVGHSNQVDACRLAEHAARSGADAVAAHSCYYLRPEGVRQLVAYCEPIAAAAGRVPFYYYHIPDLTGVRLPMGPFIESAAEALPNFAGVKYTDRDLADFQLTLAAAVDRFEVFFGWDESLLAAIALGATGAIGSTYNFLTPHFRQLAAAAGANRWDDARRLQLEALRAVEALKEFGYLRAAKAWLESRGCPCGPVRPPLEPLSPAETDRVLQHLAAHACLTAGSARSE